VDHIEEVGSKDSFSLSLDLCRQGIVSGPSSGFNLKGLYQFIEKRKINGSLASLAGQDGEIHCVFLCCDLPYQYINDYFSTLGEEHFPAIHNEVGLLNRVAWCKMHTVANKTSQHLTKVDLYRYDDKWERQAADALSAFFDIDLNLEPASSSTETVLPKPGTVVIDLRQSADFDKFHLPGSLNIPISVESLPSPFKNPNVLESLWLKLEEIFKNPSKEVKAHIAGTKILVLCYDGDSARVATSVLNAKGYESESVKGGFRALSLLSGQSASGDKAAQANMSIEEVLSRPVAIS
jgi:rhodanese-related sulfurtransferase